MRAGLRIATTTALWAFAFVAAQQLHLAGEKSGAAVVGALLWLLSCVALARGRPRAQARRLVVLTGAVSLAMFAASVLKLVVDNTLVPELIAAVSFLATLQCFAAAMAEITYDLGDHFLEMSWEFTGRLLVVVDVASVGLAIAWATNVVERRSRGRFRVTDVDLGPIHNLGRVVLGLFVVVLVVAGGHFLMSTWRT